MRILALASWPSLNSCARDYLKVEHEMLRAPETGLVMLRGRMGGTGTAFNLGEATVTRCAVRFAGESEGHAYVMGRNIDHALLAAICDGLLQQASRRAEVMTRVIEPLRQAIAAKRETQALKAAATKVDFFTLVRGDV
ncbi:MAG: phosphonate C-P lyase system protein PhnG [Pseudomonadota bacterium]|nr:phosphonate C-P lyase system protein PhnG [Pseudomonadota bacterium]